MEYSKVLYDRNDRLLSATVTSDGQWRFPLTDDLPDHLKSCIILYEDEYFYHHPGINPISIYKAFIANVKAKKVVRGGSTITMQLMRMYRGNRSRTIPQKIIEMMGALKLELLYSKEHILKMWATIAPFGGNTVGARTAAERYYHRNLNDLSWAEYATLAVLPNSPSAIHMTKNRGQLKAKRDELLNKLLNHKILDEDTYILACSEEIAVELNRLPQMTVHLSQYLQKEYPELSIFNTTLDYYIQEQVITAVDNASAIYQLDGIDNMSVIVIDIVQDEVMAYIGNSRKKSKLQYVDCAQGQRSYGSLLKPFLYSYALDKGYFTPHEWIKDIPTNIGGFTPKNFDRRYRGLVPFSDMVSRSLNIPAVRTLNYVGLEGFHHHLRSDLGMKHLHHDPHHHGLSLILGGAESSLWEMVKMYKGLFRNHFELNNAYTPPHLLRSIPRDSLDDPMYHPTAIWHTIQAMTSLNRPKEEQHFAKIGGERIAWKTGTSYGHRDAWAIGANDRYLVGVWVGNETGEGVYDLTGVKKAAPVLFKIFRQMKGRNITEHMTEASAVKACNETGRLAGRLCKDHTTIFLPQLSQQLRLCYYHEIDHRSGDTLLAVGPVEDYYYEQYHGISINKGRNPLKKQISIIYPEENAIIKVPKKLNNQYAQVKVSANTTYAPSKLFWFLDDQFIKTTEASHELPIALNSGTHTIHVNDLLGNEQQVEFQVVKE